MVTKLSVFAIGMARACLQRRVQFAYDDGRDQRRIMGKQRRIIGAVLLEVFIFFHFLDVHLFPSSPLFPLIDL